MSEKELNEEAKRRYPIGSKIKSLSGDSFVLGGYYFTFHNSNKLGASSEITRQILYDNGDWAKIENEEFVLTDIEMKTEIPEEWFIKITKENHEELGLWREDGQCGNMKSDAKPSGYILSNYMGKKGYWSQSAPHNYKEITTEKFRKYILNIEETSIEKEIIERKTINLWE